jgi:hypothetical protein
MTPALRAISTVASNVAGLSVGKPKMKEPHISNRQAQPYRCKLKLG